MYKIYNNDCLEILNQIEENTFNLILVDPPYGITDCVWDNIIDNEKLLPLLYKVLKPDGRLIVFGSSPFYDFFMYEFLKSKKFTFSNELIWCKRNSSNPFSATQNLLKKHEKVMVLNSNKKMKGKKRTYNPYTREIDLKPKKRKSFSLHVLGEDGNNRFSEKAKTIDVHYKNYPTSLFECANEYDKRHPTAKPVLLLTHLLKIYSNENDTVLDYAMGSGSTGIACIKTKRNFIGIEKDKNYFNYAKKWMEDEYEKEN